MRKFRRPVVRIPTLGPHGAGGKKRAAHIREYEESATVPSSFPRHWTEPDVRGALYAMQGQVCAYCGADIGQTGFDVDHFRPKNAVHGDSSHDGYWWLAYVFSNHLLSCVPCNQRYKRNMFPIQGGSSRLQYQDHERVTEEQRVLLDPTLDPVEDWIVVDWEKQPCKLVPRPGLAADLTARIEDVIEFFRLNLRRGQRRSRLKIQQVVIEKIAAAKVGEVRELAIRYRPHSIVARQILEATVPDALPTPDEELTWLLEDLSSELILKLEDLDHNARATELDRNEAKELMWALAVIWKDPPVGTSDSVRQFLVRRGLEELIEGYAAKL